jgi:hypothetical protein
VFLELDCWTCDSRQPRPNCPTCKGTGRVDLQRCPWSQVSGAALQVCDSLALLDLGVLPMSGGWAEQAAPWYDAAVIALQERAEYQRLERDKLERESKRKSKRR